MIIFNLWNHWQHQKLRTHLLSKEGDFCNRKTKDLIKVENKRTFSPPIQPKHWSTPLTNTLNRTILNWTQREIEMQTERWFLSREIFIQIQWLKLKDKCTRIRNTSRILSIGNIKLNLSWWRRIKHYKDKRRSSQTVSYRKLLIPTKRYLVLM